MTGTVEEITVRMPVAGSRRRHGHRRARIAAAALALLVVGQALSPVGAGATSNGRWSLTPYSDPGTSSPRSFFDYSLRPGQTIVDQVVLANLSATTLSFRVYPSDAVNVAVGGAFGLLYPNSRMQGLGDWVHSGVTYYSVPPAQEIVFKFTLTVPPGTPPGDYAGGIVALDQQGTVGRKGALDLTIQQAVGVRIFVHVAGQVHAGVAITGMKVEARHSGLLGATIGRGTGTVDVTMANTGTTILSSLVTSLTATGAVSRGLSRFAPIHVPDLLPGSTVVVQFPWTGIPHGDAYRLAATGHHHRIVRPPGVEHGHHPVLGRAVVRRSWFCWRCWGAGVLVLVRVRRRRRVPPATGVPVDPVGEPETDAGPGGPGHRTDP